MKKLLAVTLLITSFFTHSEPVSEICSGAHDLAKVVMQLRQQNISIVSVLSKIEADEMTKNIIILAYEKPLYSTQEMKDKTVADFANEVFMICYKATNEG